MSTLKGNKRFHYLILMQVFLLLFLLAKVGFTGLSLWGKKDSSAPVSTPGRVVGPIEKKGILPAGSQVEPDPEMLQALQRQSQTLESRRLQVEQKEKDLLRIRMEIDGKINELNQLQGQLKKLVAEAKTVQDKKVQHLSEIFCAMPSEKAARMIEKMDNRTVTEVFQTMRSKEVGGILTHLDPARAARISADLSLLAPRP